MLVVLSDLLEHEDQEVSYVASDQCDDNNVLCWFRLGPMLTEYCTVLYKCLSSGNKLKQWYNLYTCYLPYTHTCTHTHRHTHTHAHTHTHMHSTHNTLHTHNRHYIYYTGHERDVGFGTQGQSTRTTRTTQLHHSTIGFY